MVLMVMAVLVVLQVVCAGFGLVFVLAIVVFGAFLMRVMLFLGVFLVIRILSLLIRH